jgi:hypothetical protein
MKTEGFYELVTTQMMKLRRPTSQFYLSPYQSPSKTTRTTAIINFSDALRSKHANLQPASQLRSGLRAWTESGAQAVWDVRGRGVPA